MKDKPHVLVIAPTPFFSDRGCHVRILEEIRANQSQGYRFTVCTYHLGKDVPGLAIHRSLNVPWYRNLSAGPSVHKFYLDALLLWTVLRVCLKDRPNVIHAHLHEGVSVGWVASRIFRVPMVGDMQGGLVGELLQHAFIRPDGVLFKLFRCAEKFILKMPQHLALSSEQAIQGVCAIHELSCASTIVADGVDETIFRPSEDKRALREKLSLPLDTCLIAYIGLLNTYQGVNVMLETAKRVRAKGLTAHWLVMGYPNVDRYQEQANQLGLADCVTFTGRLPYDRAPDYLAACDIGFSAKQDVTEANGKLLNYMAVGLATVATDTPVNRSLLGDEAALYGQIDDPDSLAHAVQKLVEDKVLRVTLGNAARRRVETQFSWISGGRLLADIYRELIATAVPSVLRLPR